MNPNLLDPCLAIKTHSERDVQGNNSSDAPLHLLPHYVWPPMLMQEACQVRHLNSTLFAPAEVTCQVVNVEPTCLHGLHGDEMADITWWKRFLTSCWSSSV
eukprot:s1430_g8.t1